ncbi:MAG: ribokinase, partial [Thermoproteota archaeon]
DGATVDDMKSIQKRGVKHVLLTDKKEILLLVNDRIYSITLPNNEVYDTTGLGDIFFTTFCCTLLKENDFLWALCFAGGAAQAALDTKEFGLKKIPEKNNIETNGSYFYNTVKFKQV